MNTESAFLAAICDAPHDDAPRLVYADWLEEQGTEASVARAEFIRAGIRLSQLPDPANDRHQMPPHAVVMERLRLQARHDALLRAYWLEFSVCQTVRSAHPMFRRGFVEGASLTLIGWCGETCQGCDGLGECSVEDYDGRTVHRGTCPSCRGTGRVGGYGPTMVRMTPLTRVTLADKEPAQYDTNGAFIWYRGGALPPGNGIRASAVLPDELFDLLPNSGGLHQGIITSRDTHFLCDGRTVAHGVLSDAALRWARTTAEMASQNVTV